MQFENISIRCETSCTVDITSTNLSHFLRFYDIAPKSMHQRSRYVTCVLKYIYRFDNYGFICCLWQHVPKETYNWTLQMAKFYPHDINETNLTLTLTLNPTNRNNSKTTERNSVRRLTRP